MITILRASIRVRVSTSRVDSFVMSVHGAIQVRMLKALG